MSELPPQIRNHLRKPHLESGDSMLKPAEPRTSETAPELSPEPTELPRSVQLLVDFVERLGSNSGGR